MPKQDISLIPLEDLPENISVEHILRIIEVLVATNFENITYPEIMRIVEISRNFPKEIFNKIIAVIPFAKINEYTDTQNRIEPKNRPCHKP